MKVFYKTPFYPYFLVFGNEKNTNEKILREFAKGKIVDIGCGSCNYKAFALSINGVQNYYGVDYPVWLNNFDRVHNVAKQFGVIGSTLMRTSDLQVSVWTDGTNLGIKSNSVDTVISFGVLEHVPSPSCYISEANGILKNGGNMLITIPFLYESHGGEDCKDDFFRWIKHGIALHLKEHGFRDIITYPYGGVGTMFSQLINSYLIKKVNICDSKRNIYYRILKGICFIPIFFAVNIICLVINYIDNDYAYAAGFHVIAKK